MFHGLVPEAMRVVARRATMARRVRRGAPRCHAGLIDPPAHFSCAAQPGTFFPGRRHIADPEVAMGLFSKDIKTMEDLFMHGLQDIYYAENQITKALPKMIDLATNRDLSKALSNHLDETRKQIERLD